MRPDDPDDRGQDAPTAMDVFRKDARVEARMLRDGQAITKKLRDALVSDLQAYRDAHLVGGKPMSLAKLSDLIGVSSSVLSEWLKEAYKGDDDRICRLVDQFLAREDQQGKSTKIRAFTPIRVVVEVIMAAVTQCITRRSIGVVTGEHGSGKTSFLLWYAERHEGAVLITCNNLDRDQKFIVDELHKVLKIGTYARHARQKMREIVAYLQSHKNTIIVVDECQKLTPDALETLRSIHDLSDPQGERNCPIILFGDEHFYALVVRSRGGERTPISPQITSRMFPVISLERHGLQTAGDGQAVPGSVYTKDDIEAIVRNQRLRLVRPDAIAWVVRLANIHKHGRLRLAARVLEIAIDIKSGAQVTIADLQASLDMFLGPDDAQLCAEEMERAEPLAVAKVG